MRSNILVITLLCILLKLSLLPSYRSTDFEVHRNWLAITYDLPLSQWYFDTTSIWTLDYPPYFAYFQWILAHVGVLVDPAMVKIGNLNYDSWDTKVFLRVSVIITDFLLMIASWLYVSKNKALKAEEKVSIFCLTIFNAGLLLVDHIHFQFNGMLLGLLVLCVYFASNQQYLALTVSFSCLVLMKHLFVPLAPIFAIFLISNYCLVEQNNANGKSTKSFSVLNFLKLVIIAGIALGTAFGPFLLQENGEDQLPQIFSRLFPFGRGLVHAYWAPNIWALYCAVDKVGVMLLTKFNLLQEWTTRFGINNAIGSNSASGLVGDFAFALLPRVSAAHCMLMLLLSMLPALWVIVKRPTVTNLIHCLVYTSLSSFMLGYHIHEKAIIIPWLLQTFVCFQNNHSKVLFLLITGAGGLGLFPLFTGYPELLVKASLLSAYMFGSWYCLCDVSPSISIRSRRLVYVFWIMLLFTFLFAEIVHPIVFLRSTGSADGSKELILPFLPLLVTSVVCAFQLLVCWLFALKVMLLTK